jgi:hypothetical protein
MGEVVEENIILDPGERYSRLCMWRGGGRVGRRVLRWVFVLGVRELVVVVGVVLCELEAGGIGSWMRRQGRKDRKLEEDLIPSDMRYDWNGEERCLLLTFLVSLLGAGRLF